MSHYKQQQAHMTAYPPPVNYAATTPPGPANYVQPAPPPGYPGNFNAAIMNPPPPQVAVAPQTQSRGDKAFWKGCCAALCCCCLLDICC